MNNFMKTKTIKFLCGTVRFLGMWDQPIVLETEDGDVDITDLLYGFIEQNNGKPAKVCDSRDSFVLKIMDSDHVLNMVREFDGGKLNRFGITIENAPDDYVQDENGPKLLDPIFIGGSRSDWSNTELQLERLFTSLSGRNAILEIEDDTLTIKVDKFNDNVPTVFYDNGNNAVLVGNYKAEDVCKPGTDDCCIFLIAGADGFGCAKFNGPSARGLMQRHVDGKMNATRVGNCKCGGRWEGLGAMLKDKSETEKA